MSLITYKAITSVLYMYIYIISYFGITRLQEMIEKFLYYYYIIILYVELELMISFITYTIKTNQNIQTTLAIQNFKLSLMYNTAILRNLLRLVGYMYLRNYIFVFSSSEKNSIYKICELCWWCTIKSIRWGRQRVT